MKLSCLTDSARKTSLIGLVGSSGSGKSTLVKLIPRLYQINSGRIVNDKYDVAKTELYSYRQQLGLILQYNL